MKQVPKYDIKWLLIIALIVMLGASWNSEANGYYNFPSEQAEFHLIRNDGMNTHLKWRCADVETCYEVFKMKQQKDNTQNCANGMWIERANGYKWILK